MRWGREGGQHGWCGVMIVWKRMVQIVEILDGSSGVWLLFLTSLLQPFSGTLLFPPPLLSFRSSFLSMRLTGVFFHLPTCLA